MGKLKENDYLHLFFSSYTLGIVLCSRTAFSSFIFGQEEKGSGNLTSKIPCYKIPRIWGLLIGGGEVKRSINPCEWHNGTLDNFMSMHADKSTANWPALLLPFGLSFCLWYPFPMHKPQVLGYDGFNPFWINVAGQNVARELKTGWKHHSQELVICE